MAGPETRTRRAVWIRRLALGLVLALVLLASSTAFVVGTAAGGRFALSLAHAFLPDDLQVEFASFSGRLVDRFEFRDVSVRLPTVEARARRVVVDWRASDLLRRRLHAQAVAIDGAEVRLIDLAGEPAPATPRDSAATSRRPPIPELPFAISFDSV